MGYSESVYLDCVSLDGLTGMVTRLALHPEEGCCWLWAHVFLPGGQAYSYNRQDLPMGELGARSGDYRGPAPLWARFVRNGDRADVKVAVPAHPGPSAPEDNGSFPLSIEASFTPTGASGSNLPGRTERLGQVEATIEVGGERIALSGHGQFHEQHQEAPRFSVPFTYGTLRGEATGAVFLIGPQRSGGFVVQGATQRPASAVAMGPPGTRRSLRVATADGGELFGELTATWRYVLPINGRGRSSSIVSGFLGDKAVSGCVNDWIPS